MNFTMNVWEPLSSLKVIKLCSNGLTVSMLSISSTSQTCKLTHYFEDGQEIDLTIEYKDAKDRTDRQLGKILESCYSLALRVHLLAF